MHTDRSAGLALATMSSNDPNGLAVFTLHPEVGNWNRMARSGLHQSITSNHGDLTAVSTELLTYHQLKPRPNFIDRADLNVNESEW